jgi:hypothetical protein
LLIVALNFSTEIIWFVKWANQLRSLLMFICVSFVNSSRKRHSFLGA